MLVKKTELVFLKNMWCRWSCPALNKYCLFFNRIMLIDKNSYTKIAIDHAIKIGCTLFEFARWIKVKDITNPKSKLPLSPKNNFGRLNKEKL